MNWPICANNGFVKGRLALATAKVIEGGGGGTTPARDKVPGIPMPSVMAMVKSEDKDTAEIMNDEPSPSQMLSGCVYESCSVLDGELSKFQIVVVRKDND